MSVRHGTDAYRAEMARRRAAEGGRRGGECRHGRWLHGDSCATCEREGSGSFWQGTATMHPVEVITDPNDRRGLDARPVRMAG